MGRVPRGLPSSDWTGPQLSERMDLLLECLERLQSRLQSQPPVRGDAAHLREQIRENSLALGELEKLGVALEGVRAQGEELLATMQAVSSDAAARGIGMKRWARPRWQAIRVRARAVCGCWVPRSTLIPDPRCPAGIQERTAQLLSQWGCLRGRCQEQERWLRELLALAERFWHGLSELAVALSDTQQLVLGLEEAGGEPEAIRTRLRTMQVWLGRGLAGSATARAAPRCGQCPGQPPAQAALSPMPCRHCGRRSTRCRVSWTRWAAWAWS